MINLKNELVGFEGSVIEFDNKMMGLGFCSEMDNNWKEILEGKSVAYITNDDEDETYVVYFEVTIESAEDEVVEASYLKVLGVGA